MKILDEQCLSRGLGTSETYATIDKGQDLKIHTRTNERMDFLQHLIRGTMEEDEGQITPKKVYEIINHKGLFCD